MKKKTLLFIAMMVVLSCLFIISASAEVTVYEDAPAKTVIQVSTEDLVVFDDGFSCPSAYICKDQTGLSLDFGWINEKASKAYTVANVVELDIPQGTTFIGQYFFSPNTTLKKCSIPDSVTTLQQCVFQQATALEELVMEHDENDGLKEFPNWMVWGCTSLKAFSMPDCITQMTGVGQFQGCTNMTALYLSKNLESIGSGAGNTASFGNCTNMFFVNEPFTYDNIPTEKPSIYYFPSKLTSLPSGGEVFKFATSLNDVLVFPVGVTEIANGWAFCGTNAISIVFLGNMTNVSTTGNAWNSNVTIYFCNAADLSSADLSMNTSATKVFCKAADNTTHLTEKVVDVEASCEVDEGRVTLCFCGYEISKEAVEGSALSHDYDYLNNEKAVLLSISYSSYSADGVKTVTCANCGENSELVANALFTCKGYSASKTGVDGIAIGFNVNSTAIAEYEAATGKTLKYGVFAVSQAKLGEKDVFDTEGNAIKGSITANLTSEFATFEVKVTGFTDEQKDMALAMGAYVKVTDDDTTEYSYLQSGTPAQNEKYCFVSYNDIVK